MKTMEDPYINNIPQNKKGYKKKTPRQHIISRCKKTGKAVTFFRYADITGVRHKYSGLRAKKYRPNRR